MQRSRYQYGSVVLDPRTNTWFFRYRSEGRQRSVRLGKFATKKAALQASEPVQNRINNRGTDVPPLLAAVWEMYSKEKMPSKTPTRLAYSAWMRNHVLPRWRDTPITNLQPRSVELWLKSLPLSPKSRVHIRGLMSQLYDFAQWAGLIPATERNPISLVKVENATRRKKPRTLTTEEFHKLVGCLCEPLRTMVIVAACVGLRASELLALKWKHVNWLDSSLTVEQRIYRQEVDATKTRGSTGELNLDVSVLRVLRDWRQLSYFRAEEDWIWASPAQVGRLPISYPWYWRAVNNAALKAGVGPLGTHTFRHTYRSWLDFVGTPIAVQQKLMRHSDIRTTMNVYGDVVDPRLKEAQTKVAALAVESASPQEHWTLENAGDTVQLRRNVV